MYQSEADTSPFTESRPTEIRENPELRPLSRRIDEFDDSTITSSYVKVEERSRRLAKWFLGARGSRECLNRKRKVHLALPK